MFKASPAQPLTPSQIVSQQQTAAAESQANPELESKIKQAVVEKMMDQGFPVQRKNITLTTGQNVGNWDAPCSPAATSAAGLQSSYGFVHIRVATQTDRFKVGKWHDSMGVEFN